MQCPNCHKPIQVGDWPWPCDGSGAHRIAPRDAQIHTSERVVVYRNPRTGEITIPPTTDPNSLINQKNAQFGLVREEVATHSQLREVEKRTGLVSEISNYDRGSATSDRDLTRALTEPIKRPART